MRKIAALATAFLATAALLSMPGSAHAADRAPLNWDCAPDWVCLYAEHGGVGDVVSSRKCGVIDIPGDWHGRILSVADRASRFTVLLEHSEPDGTVTDIGDLRNGDNRDLSDAQVGQLDFVYRVC